MVPNITPSMCICINASFFIWSLEYDTRKCFRWLQLALFTAIFKACRFITDYCYCLAGQDIVEGTVDIFILIYNSMDLCLHWKLVSTAKLFICFIHWRGSEWLLLKASYIEHTSVVHTGKYVVSTVELCVEAAAGNYSITCIFMQHLIKHCTVMTLNETY